LDINVPAKHTSYAVPTFSPPPASVWSFDLSNSKWGHGSPVMGFGSPESWASCQHSQQDYSISTTLKPHFYVLH